MDGAWGKDAVQAFSCLKSHLVTETNTPKSKVVSNLYAGHLNMTLVCQPMPRPSTYTSSWGIVPQHNFLANVFCV